MKPHFGSAGKLTLEGQASVSPLRLSDGEIHYLWHFMQGSFMNPHIRGDLRGAWGLCQRHAWGWLIMECSYRQDWLHGPAILYEDLMQRAQTAFSMAHGSTALRRALETRAPCLMCGMDYGPESTGHPGQKARRCGRDLANFRSLALEAKTYWEPYVCGACLGQRDGQYLCRAHLLARLSRGRSRDRQIDVHKPLIDYLSCQLGLYARSFRWEWRGTATEENRASLIAAVGWCSGWSELLTIMELTEPSPAQAGPTKTGL